MTVLAAIAEVRAKVPLGAAFGTRWQVTVVVPSAQGQHQVKVAARIDPQGRRREQFWCDGVRVEQAVLLRLTCAESECPHATAVRAQWQAYHRRDGAGFAARPAGFALIHESVVQVAGHQLVARPARFPCYTPCPHGAHPPLTIDKAGFDLFEDGRCLAGGVSDAGGVRRPRIPSVAAAEAYVLARRFEMLAALGRVRDAAGPDPGPGAG